MAFTWEEATKDTAALLIGAAGTAHDDGDWPSQLTACVLCVGRQLGRTAGSWLWGTGWPRAEVPGVVVLQLGGWWKALPFQGPRAGPGAVSAQASPHPSFLSTAPVKTSCSPFLSVWASLGVR